MALYSISDLLRRCKVKLNRPLVDEAFTVSATDDVWYDLLTEGQEHVMGLFASTVPDSMYGALTLLTTVDDGQTYTFGTDVDGAAIFPYGHFDLFASPTFYPTGQLVEGVDFALEGTKVRAIAARTMGAPYARWITPPNVLSASVEPTLLPIFARILIADKAIIAACEQRLKQDSSAYRAEYQENMNRILLSIKTQAFGEGGAATARRDPNGWYRSNPDLG